MRNFQGFGFTGRSGKSERYHRERQGGRNADPLAALPAALHAELRKLSLGDAFFEAGYTAALNVGCQMLFEVPAALIARGGDRCAAIRCERDGKESLFFLLFNADAGTIAIVTEGEVPQSVLDFTRSYAGVLTLIANGRRAVRPRIH